MEETTGKAWLEATRVDALPQVNVICVESNQTAVQALKILGEHNILCAPIVDLKTNKCLGLLDMLDLVTFIVDIYKDLESKGETTDFLSVLGSGELFVTKEVQTIADFSKHNPFVPIQHDASLHTVLQLLGEHGYHRLPVIDE